MPRKPSCTCGNCKVCAHRDYMRRYRDVVFPTLSEWERSIKNEVDQMTRYTCPLSVISAAAYCIELRDEEFDGAMAVNTMTAGGPQ